MSRTWTSLPGFSGEKRFRFGLPRATVVALCTLLLSSCSPQPSNSGNVFSAQTTTPAPPGTEEKPALPGQSGREIGPNGLPVLPPHGVKIEELFAPDIRDPIERVKRVENAVVELRHDFDAVMPSIMRLVSVEQDMQTLISQLDSLVGQPQGEAGLMALPAPAVSGGDPLPDTGTLTPEDIAAAPEEAPAAPDLPPQKTEALAQEDAVPPRTETPVPLQPLPLHAPQPQDNGPQAPPPPATDVATAAQPPPQQGPPPRASPVQTSPPPSPAPAAEQPASAGRGVSVTGLRLGDHGGTARVVLDVSGKTSWRRDLDNSENLLVIELPEAGWTTSPAQSFAANPLVASYTAQGMEGGKGTRLILQLKASTSVVNETTIAPDGTNAFRIVLDLKK